jgi:hypothetical protein
LTPIHTLHNEGIRPKAFQRIIRSFTPREEYNRGMHIIAS